MSDFRIRSEGSGKFGVPSCAARRHVDVGREDDDRKARRARTRTNGQKGHWREADRRRALSVTS